MLVAFFFVYLGLYVVQGASVEDLCPSRFVADDTYALATYGDTCYRFEVQVQLYWTSAQVICEGDGGNLAVITSAEQQDVIHSNFESLGLEDNPWIGLSRDDNSEEFTTWVDGTPVTYTNWNKGEGLVGSGDNCVVLAMAKQGGWNERPCDVDDWNRGYVCQYRNASIATTTESLETVTSISNTTAIGMTSTTMSATAVASAEMTPGTAATTATTVGNKNSTTSAEDSPPGDCPMDCGSLDCGIVGFETDPDTGCTLCECNDVCEFDCPDLVCGMLGFKQDPETGCALCECNSF